MIRRLLDVKSKVGVLLLKRPQSYARILNWCDVKKTETIYLLLLCRFFIEKVNHINLRAHNNF